MKLLMLMFGAVFVGHAFAVPSWLSLRDNDNTNVPIAANQVPAAEFASCLQQARWGRCEFYDCLERRFPCGARGYTRKISKHFCSKIDANYDSFDEFGKQWLNQTSICLVGHMQPIYESYSTSCLDIKIAGINAILDCNEGEVDGKDFCDFLDTNGDAYTSLMGMEEARLLIGLRDTRVFSSIISGAISCGVESLRETASSFSTSAFANSVNGFFNRISSYIWK
ncbi:uncharacterized protein LOC127876474 [Dreissena polymorpha]|uniref:Stanniocalcin n=1 Tax=Dreissena polymorpha TaxID=45954 RepID=A0A9D4KMP2_DREPO|nr:uncharacterized protein LOC127876474 [Dreissena polymorpha]KAH3842466.1 hypothetical protein DPMN_115961 [Dreissena polymorpha]